MKSEAPSGVPSQRVSMAEENALESTRQILQSLVVNVTIVVVKLGAAALTRSGSMLAEALHSSADCGNQLLLLIGARESRKEPDAEHPLGFGRTAYFWSFLVAVLLFCGGGVMSIYEGVGKIATPILPERLTIALVILGISLCLEGGATISNVRALKARQRASGAPSFFGHLRTTKDTDLVIVFAENAADSLGLILALVAIGLTRVTGDARWDGLGSLLIGVLLVGVSVFLAREVKSLLVGEAADPDIAEAAHAAVAQQVGMSRVLHLITVQQGPGEVMVSIKVAFDAGLTIEAACHAINAFEARLRAARPEVRWLFVEPDLPRD